MQLVPPIQWPTAEYNKIDIFFILDEYAYDFLSCVNKHVGSQNSVAENYYLRVWLEKALSLDFIKGNQTVPFNRARLLSLRATYTLSAIYVRVQYSVSVTFFYDIQTD